MKSCPPRSCKTRQIFSRFSLFFTNSRRVDALKLAVGLAEHQPLVVWIYHDHEEFITRTGMPEWSGGAFDPRKERSYFYGRANETMYHEFTHQVLEVFSGRNSAPAWLVEGIATYTMYPVFEMGRVSMPGNPYDASYSIDDLFVIRTTAAWYRVNEDSQRRGLPSPYGSAGSVVTFCMNGDDAAYRADFLDFLRDSYQGATRNHEAWDYLGLTHDEFTRRYAEWGKPNR